MNKILKAITIIFAAALLLIVVSTAHGQELPEYKGYVNDYANILTDEEEKALELKVQEHEKQTTNEIAIVTIPTVAPYADEKEYAIKLAEKWKPGKDDKDNGVILLVAMNERLIRIEVGMGLEGDLTDIEAKHIIDDSITPSLKEGKYYEGLNKGADGIILAITTDGQIVPADEVPTDATVALIVIAVLAGLVILFIAISPFTPLGGEGVWGIVAVVASAATDSDSDSSFGGGGFSGGGASGRF